RGQDHIGGLERVLVHRPTFRPNELQQALEGVLELLLVVLIARRYRLVVELVERLDIAGAELVLALRRDPDDHGACPSAGAEGFEPPAPSSPAGDEPLPTSALIFSSSASTSVVLDSCLS